MICKCKFVVFIWIWDVSLFKILHLRYLYWIVKFRLPKDEVMEFRLVLLWQNIIGLCLFLDIKQQWNIWRRVCYFWSEKLNLKFIPGLELTTLFKKQQEVSFRYFCTKICSVIKFEICCHWTWNEICLHFTAILIGVCDNCGSFTKSVVVFVAGSSHRTT